MRTAEVFGLTAAGIIAYSLFRKKTGLSNLVFYPKSLKDIDFDGITPVMKFGVAALNTSNQSYTLNSLAGTLYANNYQIGTVSSFIPQTVAPNSQSIVYIDVRLSWLNVVADIINAIKTKTYNQALELESFANIDGLQVPVNLKFQFQAGI